jgi:diadenosine tetraphosphatase ApaH/serine/threonine PP2A family protein phosphatase
MLTALFADVHANLAALEACLAHASARGAERHVFLGDLVGYGPDPAAVLERIVSITGAIVVQGNHDQAIELEPKTRDLPGAAYDMIVWTRERLSLDQRQLLGNLPRIVRLGDACFVHASAHHPEKWEYVLDASAARRSMDAAGTPYVFSGHVHNPLLYYQTPAGKVTPFRATNGSPVPVTRRRNWLALVGSVGQPRDGDPAAAYASFDDVNQTLTFWRVPYDHHATAARLRATGLPVSELLADRIERAC